ncbi:hypothetical protein [Bifidobacterium sp. SO4]|uniref:hypothetical protein n=1 Tax=Bifidobacterium sp. SO4 TaxID=2809030 RepID=UPI001BDC8558|nr:hypothetical protein [Bifidobacterium sp. SO4]MBT1170649.1 hypothetical protein [Bifidobacterium sp. SO4]
MSTVQDTISKLKSAEQEIWIDPPADIKRLIGRNYRTGREFPVWFYALGYLEGLIVTFNTLHAKGKAREGDLDTLKDWAVTQALYYSDATPTSEGFRRLGHLEDLSDNLDLAAKAYGTIDDWDDFTALTKALQRYLLQYKFQVDIAFPWAQVSSLVDKIWHDKYGDTIQ